MISKSSSKAAVAATQGGDALPTHQHVSRFTVHFPPDTAQTPTPTLTLTAKEDSFFFLLEHCHRSLALFPAAGLHLFVVCVVYSLFHCYYQALDEALSSGNTRITHGGDGCAVDGPGLGEGDDGGAASERLPAPAAAL